MPDALKYIRQGMSPCNREVRMQDIAAEAGHSPTIHAFAGNWILMDYLEGYEPIGNVYSRDDDRLYEIMSSVTTICQDLAELGACHADLHDGNIMYNAKTGDIKLIDWGNSR